MFSDLARAAGERGFGPPETSGPFASDRPVGVDRGGAHRRVARFALIAGAAALTLGCAGGDAARRREMLDEIARLESRDRGAEQETADLDEAGYDSEGLRETTGGGISPGSMSEGAETSSEPSPPSPQRRAAGPALSREAVIEAVLRQNPTLSAARHAWRATLERQPAADALPDPRLDYTFAPLSIGSSNVGYGQVVTVRQEFPFPGRLERRSAVVMAEAEAAREDHEAVRLELAQIASRLYDQLFTVERALEINAQHEALLEDVRAVTLDQLRAGGASQDDALRVELELRQNQLDRLGLVAQRRTARARLNGMMHRPPSAPLSPTPAEVSPSVGALPATEALVARALETRPELRAAARRVEARDAARALADHERLPDFGVMASYNSMWARIEHQIMVGVSIVVPLQLDAHDAAVREQDARGAAARARLEALVDEVRVDVDEARAQVERARDAIALIEDRMLPTARDRRDAARAGYVTGRGALAAVLDAERGLRSLELLRLRALAELSSAHADLERAVGGPLSAGDHHHPRSER